MIWVKIDKKCIYCVERAQNTKQKLAEEPTEKTFQANLHFEGLTKSSTSRASPFSGYFLFFVVGVTVVWKGVSLFGLFEVFFGGHYLGVVVIWGKSFLWGLIV